MVNGEYFSKKHTESESVTNTPESDEWVTNKTGIRHRLIAR